MAKKLESQTSLTSFAPLSPESKSQSFSIRNIFFRSKEKSTTFEKKTQDKSAESSLETSPTAEPYYITDESNFSNKSPEISAEENRGMAGILGKIVDNIIDKKKKGLQSYKDSDFKQHWMRDSNCKECYDCGEKFTTFRRRHHCRVCGQIFCWRCCSQEIAGDLIGYTEDLRVCSYCCKMVLSCVRSLDTNMCAYEEGQAFQESQPKKIRFETQPETAPSPKQSIISPARRKSSVIGFREEDIARAKSFRTTITNMPIRERPQKIEGPIQDRTHLKEIMQDLLNTVQSVSLWKQEYKDHHTKVVLGCDIVDWLVDHNVSLSRTDAVSMGQAFINAGLLECIMPQNMNFMDEKVLYKPLEIPPFETACRTEHTNEIQESLEPLWVKEIQTTDSFAFKDNSKENSITPVSPNTPRITGSYSRLSSSSSTFYLDLDVKESKVSIFKSQNESDKSPVLKEDAEISGSDCKEEENVFYNSKVLEKYMHDQFDDDFKTAFAEEDLDTSITKSAISSKNWQCAQLKDDNMEKITFEKLNEAYIKHEQTLLNQLLSNESLSLCWSDIVLPIIHRVVNSVHPDVKNDADDMDIRQYVQFKKIPGGNKSESTIISGIVFSKTVAHKKMRQRIDKPTVLLLSSSISYQRVENKLSSLDPILMQENEYLKNIIGKLTVFKPDILLAEKTVSRLAQEMLLGLGVTVALNVKPSVMERVARGTQAAIVSTVDAHLGRPQLGTCEQFKVKTYSLSGAKSKTLMFFDGCPENLGCTILLRGGSANELRKVKQVVQFMIYVAYNWQLERSFLMDEFAFVPSLIQEQMDTPEDEPTSTEEIKTESVISSKDVLENGNVTLNQKQLNRRSKFDELGKKLETESISDFSDPLHSYLHSESDTFQPEPVDDLKVNVLPTTNTFSKLLDDVILCISLNVKLNVPFLEGETGKKCGLRKFFPQEIYWSRHFAKDSDISMLHQIDTPASDLEEEISGIKSIINSKNVELLSSHKFIGVKITDMLSASLDIQALLADFRARGGMIKFLCPHERLAKEKEKKVTNSHQNTTREHSKSLETNNSGLCWEKKVDALDPCNHQTISVLFSSYSCSSDNAPNYCVNPWVVKMEFYGANDITLGGFLDRYCFRSSYICPSPTCVTPMTEHVRKFVHGTGCVHILLHALDAGVHSMSTENNIFMWSWCQICKTATPVVSMSQDTWSFSFAKYLELKFYAEDYQRRGLNESCSHSLQHDHYQYFAQNQLVAIFKYTPVLIWEIIFPAFVINVNDKAIPLNHLVEQLKIISIKGHGINSDLHTLLHALLTEYNDTTSEDFVDDLLNILKLESLPFREKIEDIQLRLTSPTIESMQLKSNEDIESRKEVCQWMWNIEDQLILLKCHIADVVQKWNTRIQEFISVRKKEQKLQAKLTQQSSKISEDGSVVKSSDYSADEDVFNSTVLSVNSGRETDLRKINSVLASFSKFESEKTKKYAEMFGKGVLKKLSTSSRSYSWVDLTEYEMQTVNMSKLKKNRADSEPDLLVFHCKRFNNTLFERERKLSSYDTSFVYHGTPGISAGLNASLEDYDTYVVLKEKFEEESPLPVTPKHHVRSKSDVDSTTPQSNQSLKFTPEKQISVDGAKPEKRERSVKTMLSQFLNSSSFTPIESPFSPLEHLLLPMPKLPIVVHEEEPSSVIAYALSTDDYDQKLQELKLNLNTLNVSQKDSLTSSPLLKHRQISKMQSDVSLKSEGGQLSSEDTFDFSLDSTDKTHLKTAGKTSTLHLEIQFSDSTTKFYCRVYYAEQFRKLRSLIFTEGEERFIRSLSHCVQWIARGGKSGSMFCKTHDDRFILKQMPRLELQSFMDLAPSYFQYLNKAYLEQKPTLLAKIVGIYRIGFKNTTTNSATKMDLLVMENLFYQRTITKKYDLKGSIRNRLVNTSGVEEDVVLLDENLLKINCDNPFYIRPHSKTILTLAISNDTQFLLEQSVMDYSLLVGLDEERGQLIVGIIDYIRTFTWDKKVEMLIKSSGILGGHGKMPTVVSPELYKIRFCEAMDSYFLWVPDRWTGLGKGVDG